VFKPQQRVLGKADDGGVIWFMFRAQHVNVPSQSLPSWSYFASGGSIICN